MSMSLFEGSSLPSYLREAANSASAVNSEFAGGVSAGFPVLSYKGKVWALVQGGERKLITNEEGDAKSSIEVVIVRANPGLSKVFYRGGFEEGSSEKPTCFSHDGRVPSAESLERQSTKCAICPMNQWGSKTTDNGKKGKACSDSKRLAVVSPADMDQAILLRVPAASLRELASYAQQIDKRRVPMHAVVTKISFDPAVAHQQFVFKPVRFLDQQQFEAISELRDSDLVKQVIGLETEVDGGEAFEIEGTPPAALPAPRAQVPLVARPVKASVRVDEDEIAAALTGEVAPAKPAAPPKPAATRVVKPSAGAEVVVPDAAPKVSRAAAMLAEADASLSELLSTLDD